MYFNDHDPPHFHVAYEDCRAEIAIADLRILAGSLPSRVLGLVMEWASLHRDELRWTWESLKATGEYRKIEPLV